MPVIIADASNLSPNVPHEQPVNLSGRHYVGLVDTGATITSVTQRVVQELNLVSKGKIPISSASDRNVQCNIYNIGVIIAVQGQIAVPEKTEKQDVMLPISQPSLIMASEFVNSGEGDVDVLIGMDIIQKSVLIISGHDQRFTMSF